MVTISLEHTTETVRGLLTRHTFEIRPGVFVGRISSSVKTLLIEKILKEDPLVDMVLAYEKDGDISFESYGLPTRGIADVEGMSLIKKSTAAISVLDKFYAKTNKLLATHLYETGKTAEYLLNNTMLSSIGDELSKLTGLSRPDTIVLCSYASAMHDIGKLAPAFQMALKGEEHISEYMPKLGISVNDIEQSYRHEIYSKLILQNYVIGKIEGIKNSKKENLPSVLISHHQGDDKGYKAANDKTYPNGVKGNSVWDENVVIPALDWIRTRFPVSDSLLMNVSENWNNSIYELLTGIVIISDWIASGRVFDGIASCNDAEITTCLDKFTATSNISKTEFKPTGFKEMFGITSLRPIQETIKGIIDKKPNFEMMLIEAPMGEGKTKCGLYAAIHSLVAANKNSLYVALPTGATASNMLKEVNGLMDDLDIKQKAELLTHTSWLTQDKDSGKYMDLIFRKFKLFSPVAVGTVDQIMTAVQNVYYNEVKLALLSSKVVLIDEIHAYDAYMLSNIKRLLEYLHEYHVPVIMMSATLSDKLRNDLLSIYTDDTSDISMSYPMVTVCNDKKAEAHNCLSSQKGKKIKLVMDNKISISNIAEEVIETANKGTCVGIVVNRVQFATDLYTQLKKDAAKYDIPVYLLHSRMPIFWKEDRVKELTALFGPNREKRPQKAIVISTQIIEMSVDVDFDCLYTQLAPSDAILQRAGRVRRHNDAGTARERGFSPFVNVVCLSPKDDFNKKLSLVPYNEELLQNSQKVLKKYNEVIIPDDIPDIVNQTYDGIKSLEHEDSIKEIKARTTIIDDPKESYIEKTLLPNKQRYLSTRDEGIETITIFMGSNEELKTILDNTGTKEHYIDIYGNTIITTPIPKTEEVDKMKIIEGGYKYFEGILDGRTVYELDIELGLVKSSLPMINSLL